MRTILRRATFSLAAILALGLSGCVGTGVTTEVRSSYSQQDKFPNGSTTGSFCANFTANGGDGATIGTVQIWLPREQVLTAVQGKLAAMGNIAPPNKIADAWNATKDYYQRLDDAVQGLPEGGSLTDSALIQELTQRREDFTAITDYYFAEC